MEIKDDHKYLEICENAMYNANDIIILLSDKGKILKVNKKALETYGYIEEELLLMTIFQLRNKDKLELINTQLEKAKLGGIEFQTMHYKKDGSSFYVEVKSIGIESNEDKFVLSIIRDITSRIKSEQEIRQLAFIMENSQDAIIGKNLYGIITNWNKGAEKIYGFTKAEAIGKHILLIMPKEKIHEFYEIMNKLKKGDKVEEYETIRKKKNGEIIYVSITISSIYDLSGNLIGASSIIRDVTEKKLKEKELRDNYEEISALYEELSATEEELRANYEELEKAKEEADRANRAKSQFLANMSHEIRTPMNGIIGILDLLKITKLNDSQREYLDIASHSSSLLLDIFNTILDISKVESGKFELTKKSFNIKKTLDRTINELSIGCINKNLEVFYYIDPFIDFNLIGDELRLNQVLVNIINNAIKFTEKGQIVFKVKISSRFNNKLVLEFSVQDTGIGIKEEFKKNIFRKFVQQDMSYTKKYHGTGLGLTISKEIVKIMNGDIWFESKESHGSTFYFTAEFLLDFNNDLSHDNLKFIELNEELAVNKNKKILIVEDNEINMKIACKMLEVIGYDFICAYNGRQALLVLEENYPDLILMDIQMPELNGYETTKIIREYETEKHIPIIAMTAYAMRGDREMCIEIGMDDYISKPFEATALKNIIAKFI